MNQFKTVPARKAVINLPTMSERPTPYEACVAMKGPVDAIPSAWIGRLSDEIPIPELSVTTLLKPYVFGGHVRSRSHHRRHSEGQLLLASDLSIIPQSYVVMDGCASLPHVLCDDREDIFAGDVSDAERLEGEFYFTGNTHIHFGHFVLEGLAKLWALRTIPHSARVGWQYLTYEQVIPPFALSLFRSLGIEYPRPALRLSVPDVLHVPDSAVRTHHWIAPEQVGVWNEIGQRIAWKRALSPTPRRIYLSRRNVAGRPLVNEEAVERLFATLGFEIVQPEMLSIEDQISLCRNAETIAGCTGSQMYLCAFQRKGGNNLIIAPENWFLKDDVLIADAVGHELGVFFGSLIDFRTSDQSWRVDIRQLFSFVMERLHVF